MRVKISLSAPHPKARRMGAMPEARERALENADAGYEAYQALISKLDAAKATQKFQKMQNAVDRTLAAAQRRSMRVEDAGPMDIASEKCEPAAAQIDLLKWFVKTPKKRPPKAMLDRLGAVMKDKADSQAWKNERKAELAKFPNLVGSTISWKDRTGKIISGTVIKQMAGKWGNKPKYKAQVPGQTGTWGIPHQNVVKVVTPKNIKSIVQGLEDKKQAVKQTLKSFSVGQEVEWNSKRMGKIMKGKIVGTGRTKIKVDVNGGVWTIPLTLVLKVDGKKL